MEDKLEFLGPIKKSLVYHSIQLQNAMQAGGYLIFSFYIILLSVPLLLQHILINQETKQNFYL